MKRSSNSFEKLNTNYQLFKLATLLSKQTEGDENNIWKPSLLFFVYSIFV